MFLAVVCLCSVTSPFDVLRLLSLWTRVVHAYISSCDCLPRSCESYRQPISWRALPQTVLRTSSLSDSCVTCRRLKCSVWMQRHAHWAPFPHALRWAYMLFCSRKARPCASDYSSFCQEAELCIPSFFIPGFALFVRLLTLLMLLQFSVIGTFIVQNLQIYFFLK